MMSLSTYFKQMDKELVEKLTPHLRHKTMDKSNFIVGDEYIYGGTSDPMTYTGESYSQSVGIFTNHAGTYYHYEYRNMSTYTQQQYPNPPLPHCEERIAFAKGANIESRHIYNANWWDDEEPQWLPEIKYRVKVEKTKDDLRIEQLERYIFNTESAINVYKKELAGLKPTVHY